MTGEIIQYQTEDGTTIVRLQARDGNVWLSQADMAELFQTTVSNINKHIKGIMADGEQPEATIEDYSIVRSEGARRVERRVAHYSLPMIMAVGFRVRSPRGSQFRRWAAASLSEYLIKGFVMDDARLKAPQADYFEELLARIRDIRASEKLFYKKVLDIYATAVDYDHRAEASQRFFQAVQNKMHHAADGSRDQAGTSRRRQAHDGPDQLAGRDTRPTADADRRPGREELLSTRRDSDPEPDHRGLSGIRRGEGHEPQAHAYGGLDRQA